MLPVVILCEFISLSGTKSSILLACIYVCLHACMYVYVCMCTHALCILSWGLLRVCVLCVCNGKK